MAHVLADAEAKVHPWADVIRAAQAQGEALDARVAALETAEATAVTRAEITILVHEIGRAAVSAGPWRAVVDWQRSQCVVIRERARALFGDDAPEVNVPPAWR